MQVLLIAKENVRDNRPCDCKADGENGKNEDIEKRMIVIRDKPCVSPVSEDREDKIKGVINRFTEKREKRRSGNYRVLHDSGKLGSGDKPACNKKRQRHIGARKIPPIRTCSRTGLFF